jgi:hypothetical protein
VRQAEIPDIDRRELETGPRRQSHGAGHLRIGVRDGRGSRDRRGVPAPMSVGASFLGAADGQRKGPPSGPGGPRETTIIGR